MKGSPFQTFILTLVSLSLSACNTSKQQPLQGAPQITATIVRPTAVTLTQQYVGHIQSHHRINVCAPATGNLAAVQIGEGQSVKAGDLMFNILPVLFQAKLDAKLAENKAAQVQYDYVTTLCENKIISTNELARSEAKLQIAAANAKQAEVELSFTSVKAPFDGIVDRLRYQQGAVVQKGDRLTTLADNSQMWVYFNVPEARYLEYMAANLDRRLDDLKIELVLANGDKFDQAGQLGAIEADFNPGTGAIPFRADFPNPSGLLRHGQTGNVLLSQVQQDAIVIPKGATFEIGPKRCVFVVDQANVAHRREIVIQNELERDFVVKTGVGVNDKIVVEGISRVRDGDRVELKEVQAEKVVANLKHSAHRQP
jgi:membrane fusion protein (multidrug efflux system)